MKAVFMLSTHLLSIKLCIHLCFLLKYLNEARMQSLNESDSLMFLNVSSVDGRQNSHLHAC